MQPREYLQFGLLVLVVASALLGVLVLLCTALYAIPRTSVLGAILLTAFLGGATAAKVRLGDLTSLNSVVIGVLAWGGLYLRDERIRALLPLVARLAPPVPE